MDAGIWTVPATRTKAGKEHRVPLSDRALQIVRELQDLRVSDFVFPGQRQGRPMSNMAHTMLVRRLKPGNYTVHGFRSTFHEWAGDETHFSRDVAESALAHRIGNEVERAYRRADALEKWRELMAACWRETNRKDQGANTPVYTVVTGAPRPEDR